ncbi:hypothetical protein ENUP19_0305G0091 [Entamoeba nuttalli]|uniref:ER membrane protein complex subunit 1 n=2 Tax=Entamoeba nuttalli TaxID=412467 RepID=K2GZG8_ENTNP|nr:hypothetical protein ENU1_085770 [Entamoeba nuttalli P19]EKE40598.1 hypothetical protein ENU1_085770 [Entamoeba nuttalli P19]|eukprot:XP_008857074.1 hypothetical protein ENU1_085770 [Entamoeba nuttalli P19]
MINPLIFIAIVICTNSIRVENQYYKKGLGTVDNVAINKDIFFYSSEEGILSKSDIKGHIAWRRTIGKNGKKVTASTLGVFVLYNDSVSYFDSRGELEYTIDIIAQDIEASDFLYLLKDNIMEKRALRDGSLITSINQKGIIRLMKDGIMTSDGILSIKEQTPIKVEDYSYAKKYLIKEDYASETDCDAQNERVCVQVNKGKIRVLNRVKEVVFERDDTIIVNSLITRGVFCFIRKSGNIYALLNNEEVFIKSVIGTGEYILFSNYDERIYSEDKITKELLQEEIGVVDMSGNIITNNVIKTPKIKIAKKIEGGVIVIDINNNVYSIGSNVDGKFIASNTELYQINNKTAIPRRNYKSKQIFTINPEEVNGVVGKAQIDRSVKVPFALKSLAIIVDESTIQITEIITGKVISSVKLPQGALKTECVLSQGLAACFINTPKNTVILTIEMWEKETDWKATSYDVYHLPEIATNIKSTTIPYFIDIATISISSLGVSQKAFVIYSQKHIYILNPRRLLGTKAPFEMTREDAEMGELPYSANLNITKENLVTKEIDLDIDTLQTHPGTMESTTIVVGTGIDLYISQVTPILSFDSTYNFNKPQLFITTIIVLVVTVVLSFITKKKK